jgi:uncharacterized protein YbcC (UPF0753/DUF2309 family)
MTEKAMCDTNETEQNALICDESNASPFLLPSIREACKRIAPLWPLKDFVAVNPFLGMSEMSFVEACTLMGQMTHGSLMMPAMYYNERLQCGELLERDLENALATAQKTLPTEYAVVVEKWTVPFLVSNMQTQIQIPSPNSVVQPALTVADMLDLAEDTKVNRGNSAAVSFKNASGISSTRNTTSRNVKRAKSSGWQPFIVDEISKWCSAYYDEGQASWRMPWRDQPLFTAWKQAAMRDFNPEVQGLAGFRDFVKALPDDQTSVIASAIRELGIPEDKTADFLHRELMSVAGWSGYVQYRVRDNQMNGLGDSSLEQLLAIRLAYDVALYCKYNDAEFRAKWVAQATQTSRQDTVTTLFNHIWQLALENAYQRTLLANITKSRATLSRNNIRPAVQAIFCIDVRSEPFRRALEDETPEIETLGFAGFFGFPLELVPMGEQSGRSQCPVLLKPTFRSRETFLDSSCNSGRQTTRTHDLLRKVGSAWNVFKTSAVSCFTFVETAGVLYGAKLAKESAGRHGGKKVAYALTEVEKLASDSASSELQTGDLLSIGEQVEVAANALHKMGIASNIARIVLLCGHGSQSANNPYEAALNCGACGGHTGEANARVAAAVLNNPAVREGLRVRGINIPADTVFLAGLHNTTTDEVSLFDIHTVPQSHKDDILQLHAWLKSASNRARVCRVSSLGYGAISAELAESSVHARSEDWAQTRPEWGLAGNASFIAAPRSRTMGLNLGGRAFLHNYDYAGDEDGSILELIMMAPLVVASWINLQYFASTVNNTHFGSGNKTIHNVVGTLGIWEGNSGDLRVGLPLQSLHDGEKWRHEPLRLTAVIEAPRSAINRVIDTHTEIRNLVDNGWIHLMSLEGSNVFRYVGDLHWCVEESATSV